MRRRNWRCWPQRCGAGFGNLNEAVEVAYVGGVFHSRALLERFRMLVELEEGNRCIAPRHGPVEGALLEAYRSVGKRVSIRHGV